MEHSAACGIMVLVGRRLFHTLRLKPTPLHYLSTWQGWLVRHCWRFNVLAPCGNLMILLIS